MAHKIQIKRGNKADLPTLDVGEFGLCQDTNELFIGNNGNQKIFPPTAPTISDVEGLQTALDNKVDNSRVLTNVPVNAKFTDTTYSEISTSEIDAGTSSTRRTITGRRVKYILDKVQGWIGNLTKADVGLDSVDNVKQATKVEFDAHKAEKASQNKLGHVKVDEKTIFINEDGEISVNNPYPHDLSGSPGSKFLISGTMEEGFFGEVPASELITGDALASECGISQGTSQHSTAGWLKFAYKGEILFVAKKPIRHSISWNAINTAKCVYGDSGDKTVTIDGLTYKVTLMRALEPSNDPKTVASASSGEVNHGSEWNRLMCQIHEQALNKSWDYPNNVENDIGILEHSLGNGSQGMYDNADLFTHYSYGNGSRVWCQEMSTLTSDRLGRGNAGVSVSGYNTSSSTATGNGWRPVLRLVGED